MKCSQTCHRLEVFKTRISARDISVRTKNSSRLAYHFAVKNFVQFHLGNIFGKSYLVSLPVSPILCD